MSRLDDVLAAIDAANAGDPVHVEVDGVAVPQEVRQAELVTGWVRRLRPDASEELLIAARAHHVQRWRWPRGGHPPGRAGYLRWRRELQGHHVEIVSRIMEDHGCTPVAVARVGEIMGKRRLASDAEVRTYEDALALAFVETQMEDLAARTDRDKMVAILVKTFEKMSPAGLAAAGGIELGADGQELLAAATAAWERRSTRP